MNKLLSDTRAKIGAIILFVIFSGIAFYSLIGINAISDNYYYLYGSAFSQFVYVIASSLPNMVAPLLIFSILLALALFVFLLVSAGHRKNQEEIQLNHLDKMPLDLYLAIALILFSLLFCALDDSTYLDPSVCVPLITVFVILMSLIVMGACMTCAARLKYGKWWKNTIIFRWLMKPLTKILRWLWQKICLVFANLPLLWKGLLIFIAFAFFSIVFCTNAAYGSPFFAFLLVLLGIITILFICTTLLQMNTLKEGAAKMAAGNLEYRVETKNMFHELKDHGANLNRITEGMAKAVDERMKSEHFKTELITNVSHDLKTPLTSIINYVDLLQKEKIKNPQVEEYIDILARQAAKLKKLTEDLVEASKASTGNVQMELTNMETNEFIRQIMGEYAEKFSAANLEIVVTIPEERYVILADGRSLWRVFDNLLNNICKYSQPKTRVFIELKATREKVWISLKNTSRDLLNVSAEDLMERFVRGDSSRTSEGSGLGLSIARSLTELQKGDLELTVDGDLFKVKLGFDRIYD